MSDYKKMADILPVIRVVGDNSEEIKEYERSQEEIRIRALEEKYRNSGVPEKFFCHSFNTFDATEEKEAAVKNAVLTFAEKPENKILVLCGTNGGGKTHLACSVIRKCGGKYITSTMLCLKYDAAIGFKADMTREEIISYYSKLNMLVIDECGKYFLNSELEKFLLIQIVCGRYENNKPTVLVTNANKKTFIEFMGRAVYDRLTEVCSTVEFDFESKRQALRK